MMSLASQMYDYYVKPYLGEKGQDLVEYALLNLQLMSLLLLLLLLMLRLDIKEGLKNPCYGRSSLDRAAALLLCPKNLAYMNQKEESA